MLAVLTATLNDQKLERYQTARVQDVISATFGEETAFTVDEGGGLHDASGTRVGAIRRTDTGEWIAERQNETADRSDTSAPAKPGAS